MNQRGSSTIEWLIWIFVIGGGLAFGGGTVAFTLALVAIFFLAGS